MEDINKTNLLKSYIENCENHFDFEIHESKDDTEYENITKPHFKDCKNPDGSGPNKGRVPTSKITDGFIYIVAKDKKTGEICGAESFQMYQLTNQAIPAVIYYEAMQSINKKLGTSYKDIKTFMNDYKDKLFIFETHRLMSWKRGYHLAAVMIHKLEEYAISKFREKYGEDKFPIFFETVNDYSKKAFELCGFSFNCENENYSNIRKMGSKTKYVGGKFSYI